MGYNLSEYDRYIYDKELKNFLPSCIIDCHTHIYKKEFSPFGAHNGGSSWTDRVADELTVEDLVQTNNVLFPDKKVIPLIFGGVLQNLKQTNDYVLECGQKYGFPMLYRTDYSMTPDFLESEVKRGFSGLKPYLSNCPPHIPAKDVTIFDFLPKSHLEVANKNGWVIMLHIPRDKRLRDEVNLSQLSEIEKNYPDVKLIVAHIGRAYAKEDFGNAFEILRQTKNLMFDFTANLLDEAMIEAVRTVGVKRFLYGSDLPIAKMRMYRIVENGEYFNIVPKGLYGDVKNEQHMRETDEKNITNMLYEQLLAFKRASKALSLNDSDIEDIMCLNAARLLNLKI